MQMDLKTRITSDIKEAMKSRDSLRLGALRFLHSAIKNQEIEIRPNKITDKEILSVIKKIVKKHKDSIAQFKAAGRDDLVGKESSEMKVIEIYLPESMSSEELEKVVDQVFISLGVTSMAQMGAAMKEVISLTKGQADNKLISDLIKAKLQSTP